MDVVIGCVDNRLARLYLNRLCWRAGKPWVDGGILNLSGQVAVYGPGRACYECGLTELAWKEIRTRLGCTDMARRYAVDGHAPTTPIAASVIGALQVQEAIKAGLGIEAGSLMGKMLTVEGDYAQFSVYEQRAVREECMSHYMSENLIPSGLSSHSTLEALWAFLRGMGVSSPVMQLDHSVAMELEGVETGRRYPLVLPLPMYSDAIKQQIEELAGEELAVPRGVIVEEVRPGMGLELVKLWQLGIPSGHWLRIGRGEGRLVLALDRDDGLFQWSDQGISLLDNPWWEATADVLAGWWNGLPDG
ncbi:MAG: ThiF family adenylyltransferase [Bacteroidia bacterium]